MTLYVRSTNGTSGSGSAWATAKVTIQAAGSSDVPGDDIYVSQAHAEDTNGTIFAIFAGTTNSPVRVICANDNAEPPVSATSGATIRTSGTNSQIQFGGNASFYGLNIINSGTATCETWLHDAALNAQFWDLCNFEINSATFGVLWINSQTINSGDVRWRNVTVKFGGTSGAVIIPQNDKFTWELGGFAAGSFTPQPGIFGLTNTKYADINLTNLDFSGLDTSLYMVNTAGAARITMKNCKMPAGWTGGWYSGALGLGFRGEMYNCDSGATNIRLWIAEHMGAIHDETTLVKATGASDGVSSYSHVYSANGNCNAAYSKMRGPLMSVFNNITSLTATVTLDILHDNLTGLTTQDVGLEVSYLGASASPLGSIASTFPTNVLATGTTLTSSSASWVTTGLTNPNRQKLTVSFVPMQRGYLEARCIAQKGSYTFYVDPKPVVS